jgi:hypothetical protein
MQKQESEVGKNPDEETVEQCIARVKAENPEMTDEAARAQCTSQPAEKIKKQEDHGCGEDEVWDAEAGKCVKKPVEAEKALGDKLIAVMKEYTDDAIAKAKVNTIKRIEQVKKETENELIDSIRKGLGLNKDPVVHLSEVEGMVRKIMLGEKPHGKRSETSTPEKPSDGAEDIKKIKSAEEMWKDLTKNRTVI